MVAHLMMFVWINVPNLDTGCNAVIFLDFCNCSKWLCKCIFVHLSHLILYSQVVAKRTNRPGISTTDRGFPRARFRSRGGNFSSRARYYSGYTPPRGRGRAFRWADAKIPHRGRTQHLHALHQNNIQGIRPWPATIGFPCLSYSWTSNCDLFFLSLLCCREDKDKLMENLSAATQNISCFGPQL